MAKVENKDEVQVGKLPAAPSNPFAPAETDQTKVRMALTGPTGAGKTYTALQIATGLVEGTEGRICVIDTEQGSAALYKRHFSFDVANLRKYTPRYYLQLLEAAAKHGYEVCIIDSLTPSWNSTGGILQIADGNIRGWKDATPEYQALVEGLISYRAKMHIICTLRAKMKIALDTGITGKLEVQKLGLEPIHRDELQYEFDLIGFLDQNNNLTFSGAGKSRLPGLRDRVFTRDGITVAQIIKAELEALKGGDE